MKALQSMKQQTQWFMAMITFKTAAYYTYNNYNLLPLLIYP